MKLIILISLAVLALSAPISNDNSVPTVPSTKESVENGAASIDSHSPADQAYKVKEWVSDRAKRNENSADDTAADQAYEVCDWANSKRDVNSQDETTADQAYKVAEWAC
ncbi:uncharacterized protein KD926_004729 [Aspergillus affinis]|uniref:uncharacterized protein n=1 Tax=Aspergillus affinis TaxID=1070780 RepID=UPI0022FF1A9C|nr:uncharacterized protein KD926_004729 [Aspergillus affinis]KAI9042938.1 hypothetical protein KD926_004729 [Aspergillus affinis]